MSLGHSIVLLGVFRGYTFQISGIHVISTTK